MEDKKIVKLLFARAANAISELSTRFGKQLYRIAYNILENRWDAEECTNDTYLALWNAIPPVSPDPLAPYVYRTGRNIALKRLHKDTAKKRDSRYDVSLEELNECLPGETILPEVWFCLPLVYGDLRNLKNSGCYPWLRNCLQVCMAFYHLVM